MWIDLSGLPNLNSMRRSARCGLQELVQRLPNTSFKFLLVDINAVVSGRCRGVARDMYLGKHPLSQKFFLSVFQVRILEEAMNHEPSFAQCILGQLLFCIHACCRWKDAQRLRKLSIEFSEEESLLYADAISSKIFSA